MSLITNSTEKYLVITLYEAVSEDKDAPYMRLYLRPNCSKSFPIDDNAFVITEGDEHDAKE